MRSLHIAACGAFVVTLHAAASAQEVVNGHIVPRVDDGVTLVVNVPQRMLFRFEGGRVAEAHPVGVGRPAWPTPLGEFSVISREINPTWDVPPSIQEEMRHQGKPVVTSVPPGPANPLGKHWLGLSLHNIGIHGTSAPSSIYRATTHGCVRLLPASIAFLYANVPVGARGRVIYEPVLLVRTEDGPLLEAHPDIYRRDRAAGIEGVRRQAEALGITEDLDWALVDQVLRERKGVPTPVDRGAPPSRDIPGDERARGVGGGRDE